MCDNINMQIKGLCNPIDFEVGQPEDIEFLMREKYPSYKGVYVIYDYYGVAMYVGETTRRPIRERLYEHYKCQIFKEFAYYVKTYEINDINEIKLFERILIKRYNPFYNSDDQIHRDSKKQQYIDSNKYLQEIDMQFYFIEEDFIDYSDSRELYEGLIKLFPNENFKKIRDFICKGKGQQYGFPKNP